MHVGDVVCFSVNMLQLQVHGTEIFWKAGSSSISQVISRLLWYLKVHYSVHNGLTKDLSLCPPSLRGQFTLIPPPPPPKHLRGERNQSSKCCVLWCFFRIPEDGQSPITLKIPSVTHCRQNSLEST